MSIGLGAGAGGRLSVIVPACNYGHFIGPCLRSALSQNVTDLELLVVDDGSEDHTAGIVAGFPTVRYVHQRNQGLSAARNTGMQQSSGEYLLFLDADDLLAPDSLAPRLDYLRSHRPQGLSVCRNRQFNATNAAGEAQLGPSWLLPHCDLGLRLMHFNIAPPHAYLLHRSVADAVGWFDTRLRACEDYDFWLRALGLGHEPLYSPVGCVYYRKHMASMSADNSNQLHHDRLLHERLLDALLRARALRPSDPVCALLAAHAGVFVTLARLPGVGHADYECLLALLARGIDQLPATCNTTSTSRAVLRDYYLLTMLAAASTVAQHSPRAAAALDTLWQSFTDLGIVTGLYGTRHPLKVFAHLLSDRHAALVDRYRVARLLVSPGA